jgi:ABC-type sugar transport system substrate-binding protein
MNGLIKKSGVRVAVVAVLAISVVLPATGSWATSSPNLASFKAVVTQAMGPWTSYAGPTSTPTPPKNISLGLVVCAGAVAGCVLPAQGAAEAAKALGWTTTMYDGKGDPITENAVVTQAINAGANAIITVGVDPAQIGSALALAKSKNIPVGSITQGIAPGNGIAYDIGADYVLSGKIMGSWIITDSVGKAVVLPTSDKEFASTYTLVNSAVATLKTCKTCVVNPTQYFVGSDIGAGLGQRIAGTLQRLTKVNYVIGAFDPAVGVMVPAINNAGLGKRVKIISNVGLTQNLGFIASGNVQAADVVYDNTYEGYAAVDQMIRVLDGKPIWSNPAVKDPRFTSNEGVPQHLITKKNVGDPSKPWTASNQGVQKYLKLWGLN